MTVVLLSVFVLLAPQRVHIGDNPTIPNGVVAPPKVLIYIAPFYTSAARECPSQSISKSTSI